MASWTREIREDGIAHNRIHGAIGNGKFASYIADYNAQGPVRRTIWDLTDARLLEADQTTITAGLEYITPRVKDRAGRLTALVGDTNANFGTLRLFISWSENHMNGLQLAAFRTVEEALEWLES